MDSNMNNHSKSFWKNSIVLFLFSVRKTTVQFIENDYSSCHCDIPLPNVSLKKYDEIRKLQYKQSDGPDGIPHIFLKNCIYALTHPLYILLKLSPDTVIFPKHWKNSLVIRIHKSVSEQNIKHY